MRLKCHAQVTLNNNTLRAPAQKHKKQRELDIFQIIYSLNTPRTKIPCCFRAFYIFKAAVQVKSNAICPLWHTSNTTPPGLIKNAWKYITYCGGAETPATSARRTQEPGAPRLKVLWKGTAQIIEGSFLSILNQNEIFFQGDEVKVWECTPAEDREGGGEGNCCH